MVIKLILATIRNINQGERESSSTKDLKYLNTDLIIKSDGTSSKNIVQFWKLAIRRENSIINFCGESALSSNWIFSRNASKRIIYKSHSGSTLIGLSFAFRDNNIESFSHLVYRGPMYNSVWIYNRKGRDNSISKSLFNANLIDYYVHCALLVKISVYFVEASCRKVNYQRPSFIIWCLIFLLEFWQYII